MSYKKTLLAGSITLALSGLTMVTIAQAHVSDANTPYTSVNNLMALDTKPANNKKCQVRDNTGTDDKGRSCVCTDDPDGDPYLVWVCQ